MVLQKRSYFGFNGYQAPPIPRGARSFRRRGPLRKKVVDNQMCAFDLLANVADQILFEGHSPVTASSDGICQDGNSLGIVKQERQVDNHKLPNVEYCNKNNFEIDEQTQHVVGITNHQGGGGGFSSGSTSAITSSVCTDKTGDIEKKPLNDDSSQSCTLSKKLEGWSSAYTVFGVPIFENHGIGSESCSSEDPKLLNRNLSASDKYDSDVKEHVNRNHYARGVPSPCSNNVKLVGKDDDENSSKCRQRSTVMKTGSDAKIKKILASSYWRAPPKMKDRDHSNAGLLGVEMHTLYENRKRGCSKYPRSQKIYPFKKRKLLYNLPSTSDDTTHYDYEDVYEPLEKATDMSVCDFGVLGRAATSELSEAAGESTLFAPRDSQVKLKIKSFRVPELFIELPETATVGSLKKTVMEAITTLLGGGLHIGVLVQGRKIKDDTRTLLQSGISQDNKVDTLGFILEPNHSQIHKPTLSEKPYIDIPQTLSSSLADNSLEKGDADSKSLVVIPESNMQALELMPPLQKSKRPEMGQRRIRRPFSVSEVEALVQAVEELGTGRWRDVKLRAFDNVNHRTYVDLKDKWKTLVHTARISPQQRRGEPVPQELLDRVLAAHSYWSHQQAKERPETCLV